MNQSATYDEDDGSAGSSYTTESFRGNPASPVSLNGSNTGLISIWRAGRDSNQHENENGEKRRYRSTFPSRANDAIK